MKKYLIAKYTNKSGKTEKATDNCCEVLDIEGIIIIFADGFCWTRRHRARKTSYGCWCALPV